jgi:hypothetical protein
MKRFIVFAFLILATFALTTHGSHLRTQSHEEVHMQKDPIWAELKQKLPFESSED